MKTIDEIYQLVEESSHETAFNRGEVEGLYEALEKLATSTKDAVLIEVGVEYGRSTTVLAEFAKANSTWKFFAIDNWCQANSEEAKAHVIEQIKKHGWYNTALISGDGPEFAKTFQDKIDFVHIDGDHEYEPVLKDMESWLPKVKKGGFACFDDYGHDSLPGVFKATTEYFSKNGGWEFVGRFGNKLGIFKKL